MKVHYTSSLWSEEKGACGSIQKTNWQFEHLGLKRCIPCIYHFRDGIVFDLLTLLDTDKLKACFEKYAKIEDKLMPIERQCAEQEHPYQEMNIHEIWIDGHKIEEGYSSTAATSMPFARENSELLPVQKAYRSILDETVCFNCHRFCVPYPKTGSAMQKLLRALHLGRINTLKLITHEQRRFYPILLRFTLSDEDSRKTVGFVHPVTKRTHNLYLQLDEAIEIPQDGDGKQPFYSFAASYEIEPPLQQNERLQFDSSISYTLQQTDDFLPTASSFIGIIGGADGPTAIFATEKGVNNTPCGSHGLLLHTCFSTITLEKSQTAHFIIQGLDTKTGDSVIYKFKK
jgi:hypothetical protein